MLETGKSKPQQFVNRKKNQGFYTIFQMKTHVWFRL